jgi:hypothetical protein
MYYLDIPKFKVPKKLNNVIFNITTFCNLDASINMPRVDG